MVATTSTRPLRLFTPSKYARRVQHWWSVENMLSDILDFMVSGAVLILVRGEISRSS
jgi:hypothetical protein